MNKYVYGLIVTNIETFNQRSVEGSCSNPNKDYRTSKIFEIIFKMKELWLFENGIKFWMKKGKVYIKFLRHIIAHSHSLFSVRMKAHEKGIFV